MLPPIGSDRRRQQYKSDRQQIADKYAGIEQSIPPIIAAFRRKRAIHRLRPTTINIGAAQTIDIGDRLNFRHPGIKAALEMLPLTFQNPEKDRNRTTNQSDRARLLLQRQRQHRPSYTNPQRFNRPSLKGLPENKFCNAVIK